MAEGILGLGRGQASALNQDLIDKLKKADRESQVNPLEKRIEDISGENGESTKVAEIIAKANELLESIKPFDLYVKGGVTAFDQKSANVTGDSAIFNATDVTRLSTGTTTVHIEQLAKRDVYQSNTINKTTKDTAINSGELKIEFSGKTHTFDTTDTNYDKLVEKINYVAGLSASVEQVGDDSYKVVIKSTESGTSNSLKITGTASQSLGYTSDGTTIANGARVQEAQNLKAKINGVDYNVSSNVITIEGGLKITAVKENKAGENSTIAVEKDTSTIESSLNTFVTKYNEFVSLVDSELGNDKSKIKDKASIRGIKDSIRDQLFSSYGKNDDLNLFNFGFNIDKSGTLSLDSSEFNKKVENNLDDLKSLFLGVAEKEGLGTKLRSHIDDLDSINGLFTGYQDRMNSRLKTLTKEKDNAIEDLDAKYSLMSSQFAAYASIITKFEASFSGLSMIIQQSTSGR